MTHLALLPTRPRVPRDAPSSARAGTVTGVEPAHLDVALADGRQIRARRALPLGERPDVGAEVVLIHGEDGWFAIACLAASGARAVTLEGDLDVRVASGSLRLSAGEAVEIAGREVELRADDLRVLAGHAVHRLTSLWQSVCEQVTLHAGSAHTIVAGTSHTQSRNATLVADEQLFVNGRAVHIG